jgi:hypothetical protein
MEQRKQKAINDLNSQRVKKEVWLWVYLFSGGAAAFILLLIFTPAICDWMDGWSPFTASLSFIILTLSVYFIIRRKTR